MLGVGVVVQWVKPLSSMPTPHSRTRVQVLARLLYPQLPAKVPKKTG